MRRRNAAAIRCTNHSRTEDVWRARLPKRCEERPAPLISPRRQRADRNREQVEHQIKVIPRRDELQDLEEDELSVFAKSRRRSSVEVLLDLRLLQVKPYARDNPPRPDQCSESSGSGSSGEICAKRVKSSSSHALAGCRKPTILSASSSAALELAKRKALDDNVFDEPELLFPKPVTRSSLKAGDLADVGCRRQHRRRSSSSETSAKNEEAHAISKNR